MCGQLTKLLIVLQEKIAFKSNFYLTELVYMTKAIVVFTWEALVMLQVLGGGCKFLQRHLWNTEALV